MRRAPPNTHLKTLLHSYGHRLTLPPTRDATGAWVYPEFLVAEAQGKLGVGVFATPAGGVEPGVWKSEPTVNLTGVNLTGSGVNLTALALPTSIRNKQCAALERRACISPGEHKFTTATPSVVC